MVSFSQDITHSYIMTQQVNIDSNFQMSLMFKTLQKDGLIFYASEASLVQNDVVLLFNAMLRLIRPETFLVGEIFIAS